ncbi:MAG: hypothetical protein RL660_1409 [Bacteroidota bacterium]
MLTSAWSQTKHKYVMQGRAYYDGTSQVYKLDITDDGSGNFTGENISILPTGERLVGPVRGRIDYAKKMIYFQELKIKNLPAGKSQDDYCFFTITATFTTSGNQTQIVGTFTSKGPRGNKCSGGTIKLVGTKNVEELHKQYIKEVQKTKPKPVVKKPVAPPPPKPKPIVKQTHPTPKPKPKTKPTAPKVKKEEPPAIVAPEPKLEPAPDTVVKEEPKPPFIDPKKLKFVDYEGDQLTITIDDYDKLDGDDITVMLNNDTLIHHCVLDGSSKTIKLDMSIRGSASGVDSIKVIANNEGYYYPNSATVTVRDVANEYRCHAENEYGERCYVILRRRK